MNGTNNARYAKGQVNGAYGVILFPDNYVHPAGVIAPRGINSAGYDGWLSNNYNSAAWAKMEAAGAVFLPAAGRRFGSGVEHDGSWGEYWSSTAFNENDEVYYLHFIENFLDPDSYHGLRNFGRSVRLVKAVN